MCLGSGSGSGWCICVVQHLCRCKKSARDMQGGSTHTHSLCVNLVVFHPTRVIKHCFPTRERHFGRNSEPSFLTRRGVYQVENWGLITGVYFSLASISRKGKSGGGRTKPSRSESRSERRLQHCGLLWLSWPGLEKQAEAEEKAMILLGEMGKVCGLD